MPTRALIFITNFLLALSACATPAAVRQQAVNPVPVAAATAPATALPAPPFGNGGYLTPVSLNLYRLLPPPPEAGSAQERAELDELLHLQATRTPDEVQRAQADATISIFRFADALGNPSGFTRQSLPLVAELFQRIGRDEGLFMNPAKDAFGRPRPFVTEMRLAPVVARPPSASYPSGHTTWAICVAIVLADMVPERRAQIFARADEYAHNREVGGVHYPSDVAAGHLAGTALAVELFNSPRFIDDEVAAADELRQALGLAPLPRHRLYRH
ncbi:MAG TPA: phosphatase PAP2 family protein [Steroidobacteraceae bacterium]|nr:phosphatase PAP2 family protein [Steroidobacteraceae bacterium]